MENSQYAKAPNSCELNKLIAREWSVQIKPVGSDPSNWQFLRGITQANVNIETSTVDSSDIDSDGWQSEEKTSRTLTITLEMQLAQLNNLPVLHPSQELLKFTGEELGADGKIDVRVWRADVDMGWECTATNSWSQSSSGANELLGATATLKSSCAPTRIHSVAVGKQKEASVVWDLEELRKSLAPKPAPVDTTSTDTTGTTSSDTGTDTPAETN